MRIQVTGARGTLGQAVALAALRRGHTVHTAPIDITLVLPHHLTGEVIINCAGLVKQRPEPDSRFVKVNGYGPQRLAEACRPEQRLIHVSTDCVFHGPGPHTEASLPDAGDIYALSKRTGEVTYPPHLTIRTSFVGFGQYGLLADMVAGQLMRVSRRLLWTGHTAPAVADLLVTLAERPDITGLLHIPGEEQTRVQLVDRLATHFSLPCSIQIDDGFTADRRLDSMRWHTLALPTLPRFQAQLETMERPQ